MKSIPFVTTESRAKSRKTEGSVSIFLRLSILLSVFVEVGTFSLMEGRSSTYDVDLEVPSRVP